MSPSAVPWRYRLETRQSIPILVGLVGVLTLLLALGYLYARERILASVRGQVAQLVGSIARQDDYNRRWLERGMEGKRGCTVCATGNCNARPWIGM